jgi:hypothetical protein
VVENGPDPATNTAGMDAEAARVRRRLVVRAGGVAVAGVAAIYVKPTVTRIQIPQALAASGGPPPAVPPPGSPPAPPADSPAPDRLHDRASPVQQRLPVTGEPVTGPLAAGLAAGVALIALGHRMRLASDVKSGGRATEPGSELQRRSDLDSLPRPPDTG